MPLEYGTHAPYHHSDHHRHQQHNERDESDITHCVELRRVRQAVAVTRQQGVGLVARGAAATARARGRAGQALAGVVLSAIGVLERPDCEIVVNGGASRLETAEQIMQVT